MEIRTGGKEPRQDQGDQSWVKHLRASPGSDRRESVHPTEGEPEKTRPAAGPRRPAGKAPATGRGPAGKSWQNRPARR